MLYEVDACAPGRSFRMHAYLHEPIRSDDDYNKLEGRVYKFIVTERDKTDELCRRWLPVKDINEVCEAWFKRFGEIYCFQQDTNLSHAPERIHDRAISNRVECMMGKLLWNARTRPLGW